MEDVSFQSEAKILFKKYKVKRKISQIDFKKVYLGKKIIDNELVAIKVEEKNIPNPSLESEAFILLILKDQESLNSSHMVIQNPLGF